jgi:hypothetical protein
MILLTPQEVSKATLVPVKRLLELVRSRHAPCVYVDGNIFFQRNIKKWVRDNLYVIQEGKLFANNIIFLSQDSPFASPPKELRAVCKEIKEYEAMQYKLTWYPPCIYFLYKENTLIYIGQTINLPSRVSYHFNNSGKTFDTVYYIPIPESELLEVEKKLIKQFLPPTNIESFAEAKRKKLREINESD